MLAYPIRLDTTGWSVNSPKQRVYEFGDHLSQIFLHQTRVIAQPLKQGELLNQQQFQETRIRDRTMPLRLDNCDRLCGLSEGRSPFWIK